MKVLLSIIAVYFIVCSCKLNPNEKESQATDLDESGKGINPAVVQWVKGYQLQNVESVAFDPVNLVYYASCGKDYKLGTNGYISKISSTGELLEATWIKDLNRPTGMAIRDNILYVADINRLLIIDIAKGQVMESIPEPIPNSGLNDVAVNHKGDLFITASFVHSIFKLEQEHLEIFIEDDEKLKWANGITFVGKDLIVGGAHLVKIDIASKKIDVLILKPSIADFDGIVSDGMGGLYATTVENSALWHINENLEVKEMASGGGYFGDLDYLVSQKKLSIARGNKETNTFFIETRNTID
ncbi:hypothetical protein [Flagellimonas sp.]|uniref:hypothetical protein n=1 Tax=Flagellimonas sp. TaxID=2058762 RepID=UPI003B509BBF